MNAPRIGWIARAARSVAAVTAVASCAACRSPGRTTIAEAHADEPAPPSVDASTEGSGRPVVELFTSEGCSSCPAADVVFADLAASTRVVALAFHVDYWNDLGWPDRFSSPDYTARQQAYGRAFGTSGVYTPQMVVGGVEPFVGSDRARAEASVARAAQRPPSVTLTVRTRGDGDDAIAVDYEAHGLPSGAVLDVAVVERAASTVVTAGENAGRTLHHVNVVRSFVSLRLRAASGSTRVPVPPSLRRSNGEVIAFVERPTTDPATERGVPIAGSATAPLPR